MPRLSSVLFIGFIIAFIGMALKWVWGKVMWLVGLVKQGVLSLGYLLLGLVALVASIFLLALLCDAIALPIGKLKKRRAKKRGMSSCRLPTIGAFRTGRSPLEGRAGEVDSFLASLLRARYWQMTGENPDSLSFAGNEAGYAAFKSGELATALWNGKGQVEMDLFAPLIAEARAGDNEKLTAWLDRSLEAGPGKRHPVRCFMRVLHFFSFGRWGLPSGGGFTKPSAKDSSADTKLLYEALWRDYWSSIPAIAELYENGLEPIDEPEEPALEPAPALEEGRVVYEAPALLLPPPSGPEYIPEPPEVIEPPEPLPEVNEEQLAAEAESVANQALAVFQGDCEAWEHPVELLKDIEATLIAISPYHADKPALHERIGFVRGCFHQLENFNHDFERVMNSELHPDEAWNLPWLARASQDLQAQEMMPTPSDLRRASLPHYLAQRWNEMTSGNAGETIDAEFTEEKAGEQQTPPETGGFV